MMHISGKEVERLVRDGGMIKVDYWVYDLFAERLEKMGFRRTGRDSFIGFDGSTYRNERADEVMIATRRLGPPITVVKSMPFSEEPSPNG
jgi:hypothetical protein